MYAMRQGDVRLAGIMFMLTIARVLEGRPLAINADMHYARVLTFSSCLQPRFPSFTFNPADVVCTMNIVVLCLLSVISCPDLACNKAHLIRCLPTFAAMPTAHSKQC